MKGAQIPPGIFDEYFRMHIRVLFDWKYFYEKKLRVSSTVTGDRDDLRRLFMPWYVSPKTTRLVAFDDVHAVPIQVSEIERHLHAVDQHRRTVILRLENSFRREKPPIQIVIPTYETHRGALIMDGNHRMAALVLSGADFRLMTFAVHGPLDRLALCDLTAWCREDGSTLKPERAGEHGDG